MGAPGVVGWCWIPAGDAGMTEGTGWRRRIKAGGSGTRPYARLDCGWRSGGWLAVGMDDGLSGAED